jgi:hypothetical protein
MPGRYQHQPMGMGPSGPKFLHAGMHLPWHCGTRLVLSTPLPSRHSATKSEQLPLGAHLQVLPVPAGLTIALVTGASSPAAEALGTGSAVCY